MKADEALKENGKIRIVPSDEGYAEWVGKYLKWDNGEIVSHEDALGDKWQPYNPTPGIRPKDAGELWTGKGDTEYVTLYHRGILCFHDLSKRDSVGYLNFVGNDNSSWVCTDEPIDGQNGWTLIHSPDSERMALIDDVERVLVEVMKEPFSDITHIMHLPKGYPGNVDGKKCTLLIPKEKP